MSKKYYAEFKLGKSETIVALSTIALIIVLFVYFYNRKR